VNGVFRRGIALDKVRSISFRDWSVSVSRISYSTNPIYDELCRRFWTSSQSIILEIPNLSVSLLSMHFYARMQSTVGRSYVLCYDRCGFKVEEEFRFGLKSSCCSRYVSMQCLLLTAVILLLLWNWLYSCVRVESVTNWLYSLCWLLLARVIVHSFYFLFFIFCVYFVYKFHYKINKTVCFQTCGCVHQMFVWV